MIAIKLEGYCYCGKKIKIKYDEEKNLKKTTCKNCGYNHMDSVYHYIKDAEDMVKNLLQNGSLDLT